MFATVPTGAKAKNCLIFGAIFESTDNLENIVRVPETLVMSSKIVEKFKIGNYGRPHEHNIY